MIQLSVSSAYDYVKRVLDELVSTEEIGMIVDNDSLDLYKLVEGAIVEAVITTHMAANVNLLDGKIAEPYDDFLGDIVGKVGSIYMHNPTLRLVSLKSDDSDVIITSVVPEDSPEGRMQLNEYTRGVYDDPILVLNKVSGGTHIPYYTYYSKRDEDADIVGYSIEYIPYPELVEGVVEICPKLEIPTLDMVASLVLTYLSETEKATYYREKSLNAIKG